MKTHECRSGASSATYARDSGRVWRCLRDERCSFPRLPVEGQVHALLASEVVRSATGREVEADLLSLLPLLMPLSLVAGRFLNDGIASTQIRDDS